MCNTGLATLEEKAELALPGLAVTPDGRSLKRVCFDIHNVEIYDRPVEMGDWLSKGSAAAQAPSGRKNDANAPRSPSLITDVVQAEKVALEEGARLAAEVAAEASQDGIVSLTCSKAQSIATRSAPLALAARKKNDDYVVDTGAFRHMIGLTELSDKMKALAFELLAPVHIQTANGVKEVFKRHQPQS